MNHQDTKSPSCTKHLVYSLYLDVLVVVFKLDMVDLLELGANPPTIPNT
jgi:hypothetical protein